MVSLHMCWNVEVNNIRYFVKTMTDITHCNGFAIAARTKIRKSPKVKSVSHGAR